MRKRLGEIAEGFAAIAGLLGVEPKWIRVPKHLLEQQPGITAASLARACLVTPQAMMILLKTMEQQGLIARSPHPRHPSVLELHMTEVGGEALHAARERVDPIEQRVFGVFSPKDQVAFREFLLRFIEAFEAE